MKPARWPRPNPLYERLLVVDPCADAFADARIADLAALVRPGDLLATGGRRSPDRTSRAGLEPLPPPRSLRAEADTRVVVCTRGARGIRPPRVRRLEPDPLLMTWSDAHFKYCP